VGIFRDSLTCGNLADSRMGSQNTDIQTPLRLDRLVTLAATTYSPIASGIAVVATTDWHIWRGSSYGAVAPNLDMRSRYPHIAHSSEGVPFGPRYRLMLHASTNCK